MSILRKILNTVVQLLTPTATLVPVREEEARRRAAIRGIRF
jgi:hypothetical protein